MSVTSLDHPATLPPRLDVGRVRPTRVAILLLVGVALVTLATAASPRFVRTIQAAGSQAATPSATSQSAQRDLSSLPLIAQATISGVLGRDNHAYHASLTSGGLRSENPNHGLTTTFAKSGVLVRAGAGSFGLTLRSLGYGDQLHSVAGAVPTATKNRVEYRRGALTEWYVNGPRGLEQGFTLTAPPAQRTSGPLTLDLTLSGTLHAALETGATGLALAHTGQPSSLRYRGLAAWDATGRTLPARLGLDGKTLRVRVDDAGASYPITIDPFFEQAKLTASDGASGDWFGLRANISGDTVVVGALYDDVGANADQGSAYVFVKPVGGWASATETAKLTASDGAAGDQFGWWADVSGDTVVVGALFDDVSANPNENQGSAYVFVKPAGGWASATETAKLTASDADRDDWFGWTAAVSGDTVVVGAPTENREQGSAYVFDKPAGGWASATETAKLTASDGANGDRFGNWVAIAGGTVVVGAPYTDFGANVDRGSGYVFVEPAAGWASATETAKLAPSDGATGDWFAADIVVSGDTILAGAFLDDVGANADQGSAYVFVEPAAGWASATETAKLTASDGAAGDGFGNGIAVSGDTIVVGALSDDIGANADQGSAYVFVKPAGGWASATETAKLTSSDGAAGDQFGWSVAVSGDTVVVAAPLDDVGANADQGSAYIFGPGADSVPPTISVTTPPEGGAYVLGQAVNAAYGCDDESGGSGLASCVGTVVSGTPIDTTTVGAKTFTVTAADNATNTSSVTHHYTVTYSFSGFQAPVDNPDTVNTGKAGRTYPVKWQLRDADGNFISALSAVVGIVVKPTSCGAFTGDPTDALEATATGGTSLRYETGANQYIYNWKTPSKGCYTLFLKLDSGQALPAFFNLS